MNEPEQDTSTLAVATSFFTTIFLTGMFWGVFVELYQSNSHWLYIGFIGVIFLIQLYYTIISIRQMLTNDSA